MELISSGEFPSVVATQIREGIYRARSRLISDVDAGIDESRPR